MMTPRMTYDGCYTYDNYTLDLATLALQTRKLDEYICLIDDGAQDPVLFSLVCEVLTQLDDLCARFSLASGSWHKDCLALFELQQDVNPSPACDSHHRTRRRRAGYDCHEGVGVILD